MGIRVERVDSLADGLQRAMELSGWSARGLSLSAGLGLDAVRDVLRQQSGTLTGDRLEKIATVLGLPPAALTGDAPWPRRKLAPAPEPAPSTRRPPLGSLLRIPEVDLRLPASATDADIRTRPQATSWTVPADLIEGRHQPDDLLIIRAPSPLPGRGIAQGDRLLVDVGARARRPSPPGMALIYDGVGHVLVVMGRVRAGRVRLEGLGGVEEVGVEEVDTRGRVVGRWSWV